MKEAAGCSRRFQQNFKIDRIFCGGECGEAVFQRERAVDQWKRIDLFRRERIEGRREATASRANQRDLIYDDGREIDLGGFRGGAFQNDRAARLHHRDCTRQSGAMAGAIDHDVEAVGDRGVGGSRESEIREPFEFLEMMADDEWTSGSTNTAASSGIESGTGRRFASGSRRYSANAPSRPRMPSTVRVAQ